MSESPILEAILKTLPEGWQSQQLFIGLNWTVAVISNPAGEQRAGLAATPAFEQVTGHSHYQRGRNPVNNLRAEIVARLVQSANPVEAAVGLATLNALIQPDPAQLAEIDAADWLVEQGQGRNIAVVGRFPFIEELKPIAGALFVLELHPNEGEYHADEAPQIIPQAEIVAITGSTLVNHTLDGLLALVQPGTKVILLGPSTPLTPILFDYRVDLLSGVQVADLNVLLASCAEGVSFRKLAGLRRVSLQKPVFTTTTTQ